MRRFAFRLARELGILNVNAILRAPATLIREWMAYEQLEPFGSRADDWRMAMICAASANSNPYLKKPFHVSDFLPKEPKLNRRPRVMSGEEMRNAMLATAASLGISVAPREAVTHGG